MTLSVAVQLGVAGGVMALVMTAMWLVQRATKNAGIVDVAWAGGMGTLAVFYALTSDGDGVRRVLVAVLAGLWSFRLTWYLFFDRFLGRPEDGRYEMLRKKFGKRADLFFLGFFWIQATWTLLFALPFLVVAHHAGAVDWWVLPGVAMWVVSICGELVADRQLAAWRANPENRGKTCRRGLWRYSRHPNYFFEWLHWWAWLILSVGSGYWWVSLIVVGLMYVFLTKVTGIPYTEKRALESRGEDYRRYQETTSPFIPWPPRDPPGAAATETE